MANTKKPRATRATRTTRTTRTTRASAAPQASGPPPVPSPSGLSSRATAWLAGRGVTRQRAPLAERDLRRYLEEQQLPAWPALLAVEAALGGLGGTTPDERDVSIGVPFGTSRMIDGRLHLCVGYYDPILWYMDEAGRIVEIDDLGERFYESDSVAHRIEQLALFDWHGGIIACVPGFQGTAVATAHGLLPLDEPSDSRQRFWASPGANARKGILVRESLEPRDYGSRELVEKTWISASTRATLERALASTTPASPALPRA